MILKKFLKKDGQPSSEPNLKGRATEKNGETIKTKNTQTLGLIIGSGKLSPHIPYLLNFISQEYVFVDRALYEKLLSKNSIAEALLVLCQKNNLSGHNYKTINIYLAVKDDQIWTTYEGLLKFKDNTQGVAISFFHFSGAKFFPKVTGIHPLMTFTKQLYPQELYNQIPLYVDHEDFYLNHKSRVKYLSPEKKPFYHALCVMLGNFPQLLIYEVKKTLEKDFEFSDFKLLVETSVDNILQSGSPSQLTGPIVRNDLKTISEHKWALKQTSLIDLYNSFISYFMKGESHERSTDVAEL